MSEIREKIAYLSGLKDGIKVTDENTDKLFRAIIDALETISEHIDESDDFVDDIAEQVDLIGDELDEVEDFLDELYDDEDDCDCDDDDCCCCDDDCDCDFDYDDDDDCIELECPFCKKQICFDSYLFTTGEELRCPCCNMVVFPEEK